MLLEDLYVSVSINWAFIGAKANPSPNLQHHQYHQEYLLFNCVQSTLYMLKTLLLIKQFNLEVFLF